MEDILWYTAKSGSLIALFYLSYCLLIQRQTFFRLNRFFLLFGLGVAAVLPLIFVTKIVYADHSWVTEDSITSRGDVGDSYSGLDMATILFAVYAVGVLLFTGRLLLQLLSVCTLLKKCRKIRRDDVILAEMKEATSPFSFFGFVVYNPEIKNRGKEWDSILLHELAHIRQRHSFDAIAANLLVVFQWWNPLAWGYRRVIMQNLEFLADDYAAGYHSSEKDYQRLLLRNVGVSCDNNVLTNTFYNSSIKKRIVMLNKNRSERKQLWRYTAVIPFLAFFLLGVNTKTVAQETNSDKGENEQVLVVVGEKSIVVTKNTADQELKQKVEEIISKDKIDLSFDGIKRNSKGEIIAIASKFKAGDSSGAYKLKSDKPIKSFRFYVKYNGDGSVDEAGYSALSTKGFMADYQKSTEVDIRTKDGKKPLLVVDDMVVDQEMLPAPEQIKSVNILKEEKATAKYGDQGKNGVIEVITKK